MKVMERTPVPESEKAGDGLQRTHPGTTYPWQELLAVSSVEEKVVGCWFPRAWMESVALPPRPSQAHRQKETKAGRRGWQGSQEPRESPGRFSDLQGYPRKGEAVSHHGQTAAPTLAPGPRGKMPQPAASMQPRRLQRSPEARRALARARASGIRASGPVAAEGDTHGHVRPFHPASLHSAIPHSSSPVWPCP